MIIFTGRSRVHLIGHKELSKDEPIKSMKAPKTVYIPLVDGAATDFDVLVKPGDHVRIGTKLAIRKKMYVPIYSSVSGTVQNIEKRMHATKRMQKHIVIDNDFKDEKEKVVDISDIEKMTKDDIITAMKELGVIGLGGSGFPTYIKYQGVKNINTIIINGVECEPYITSDHNEMKRHPKELIGGLRLLMKAADAKEGIIAIKVHKQDLYDLLVKETASYDDMKVVQVPDVYPMGWERELVRTVTGKNYDRLPAEAGVIVDNAATAIYFYLGLKTGLPVYSRLVTVSGNGVKHPGNIDVRVGTPAHEVIEAAGGYVDEGVGHIIAGGPMMGKSIMNDMFVISSYMNALTVLLHHDEDVNKCLRCGECILHCPMDLMPVRIMQAEKAANPELLEKLEVNRCIECGMCSYICPSKIEVTDFVQKGKRRYNLMLRKRGVKK